MTKKLILTRKEKLYLMKIYDLFESGAVVIGATEMAKIFSVSRPTAFVTLESLREKGMLIHISRKGYVLSEEGRKNAEELVHAHRILEILFFREIGEDLERICNMLLSMDPDPVIINKLCKCLGRPSKCPHGKKIPHLHAEVKTK